MSNNDIATLTVFNYDDLRDKVKQVCQEIGYEFVDGSDLLRTPRKYSLYLRKWKGDKKVLLHKFVVTDGGRMIHGNRLAHMYLKINGQVRNVGLHSNAGIPFLRKTILNDLSMECDIDGKPMMPSQSAKPHETDHYCTSCGYAVCRDCAFNMNVQSIKNNKSTVDCPQCRRPIVIIPDKVLREGRKTLGIVEPEEDMTFDEVLAAFADLGVRSYVIRRS